MQIRKQIKIRIKNVKKNNHNIVLRVKLSNGKKEFAAYECGYKLQQKKKRKWKKIIKWKL